MSDGNVIQDQKGNPSYQAAQQQQSVVLRARRLVTDYAPAGGQVKSTPQWRGGGGGVTWGPGVILENTAEKRQTSSSPTGMDRRRNSPNSCSPTRPGTLITATQILRNRDPAAPASGMCINKEEAAAQERKERERVQRLLLGGGVNAGLIFTDAAHCLDDS
eukprot:CAMPEP_0179461502 /NCGR_PEP_ID=MMETSP0799-20121207/44207_1 /TAXON_ID=46947 /ORGANISM="Geminigera cryophila, Strain CCMP2564" /LENGTH=160 /DNA_ID=CAMNT_0021264127 /DNA_START=72 /DNA_END=555 /DNA_ORIENTATION=+